MIAQVREKEQERRRRRRRRVRSKLTGTKGFPCAERVLAVWPKDNSESAAQSSKDPRHDISMACLLKNSNYLRYTKKNTKSNAWDSGQQQQPRGNSPSFFLIRYLSLIPLYTPLQPYIGIITINFQYLLFILFLYPLCSLFFFITHRDPVSSPVI